MAHFPQFHFSLHSLSSLSALERNLAGHRGAAPVAGPYASPPSKQKVSLLVAILETEGPDTIRIKKGTDAGKEVSILKVIVGDEDGGVCRLTAWREVAEQWGGSDPDAHAPAMKRGDIVYLQSEWD